MIFRSPFLGLCTVSIVPAVGIINKLYGDWLSKNALSVQNSLADATSCAHEALACARTVITSASEDYEIEKYAKKIDKNYALNIRQVNVITLSNYFSYCFVSCLLCLSSSNYCILGDCIRGILHGC